MVRSGLNIQNAMLSYNEISQMVLKVWCVKYKLYKGRQTEN